MRRFCQCFGETTISHCCPGKSEPSKLLVERADDVVDWEERGLVDAIRRLARGENTARFDTVEFNPDEFKDFKMD